MKKKFVFLGDINSINIELIHKSHKFLQNKVQYILLGNINELSKYLKSLKSKLKINEVYDPINFNNLDKSKLNVFNIENIHKEKYKNLLNQIHIANHMSNISKIDLVTLPINKSIFKKNIIFNGMTEYLAEINKRNTKMIMLGEKFSIIPLTTHINLKEVNKFVKKNIIKKLLIEILKHINNINYQLKFKNIKFLCFNPHCGEDDTLGSEDRIISECVSSFRNISGPYAADSAFNKINNKTLFISMYHDQALIPFKILNKRGINLTLGLNYRRLSPTHGTANDIKFKNIADDSSYRSCMEY